MEDDWGLKAPRLDELAQAPRNARERVSVCEKGHLEVGGWLKERGTHGFDCGADAVSMFSGGNKCKSTLKCPLMGKWLQVPPGNVCCFGFC